LRITTSDTPAILRREIEESVALCLAHVNQKEEAEQSLIKLVVVTISSINILGFYGNQNLIV
jgi:hypothetical protein